MELHSTCFVFVFVLARVALIINEYCSLHPSKDMTEGERRQVIIPPELGYGTDKAVGPIPKNSTLYFDMTVTKLTTPMTPLTPEALTWLNEHPL